MSDEYDTVTIAGRVRKPLADEFDEWVEAHEEHGNRSDALRALIEDAVDATPTTAADGGVKRHLPTDPTLTTVYEAILDTVGDDHVLGEEMVSAVAKAVNNNPDTGLSPDADAVRSVLQQLQTAGFARKTFRATSIRNPDGIVRWHIKPATAVPEEWRHHPDNVAARERRLEEKRLERMVAVHEEGEA